MHHYIKYLILIIYFEYVYSWDHMDKYNFNYSTTRLNQYYEVPTIEYKLNLGNTSNATPFFNKDNTQFYINSYAKIFSFYTSNFSIAWQIEFPEVLKYGIVLSNDREYMSIMTENKLYLVKNNGTILWNMTMEDDIQTQPYIDINNNIYVILRNSKVYAIDFNQNIKWIYQTPVTVNVVNSNHNSNYSDHIYIFESDKLTVINSNTGNFIWGLNMTMGFNGFYHMFSKTGTLYMSDNTIYYYAISPNGSIIWKKELVYGSYNSFLLSPDENTLYYFSENKFLYAVDSNTGYIIYETNSYDVITYSPSFSPDGQTIYATGWFGSLVAYNANDGSIRWKLKLASRIKSSPIITNDAMYIIVADFDGILYKIKSSCQEYITRCNVKVDSCDTYESINNCPFNLCNQNYYNNDKFPRCTECPITCNIDQYKVCDSYGNNPQCVFYNSSTISWSRFLGNNQQQGANYNIKRINEYYETADIKYMYQTNDAIRSSAIVSKDNIIVIHSQDKYVYAFSYNMTLLWKTLLDDISYYNAPSLSHDNKFIYIHTFAGYFYKLDIYTGEILWTKNTPSGTYASTATTKNGNVYIYDDYGYLYCYYENGTLLWTFNIPETGSYLSFTFNNNETIVYFTDNMSHIYALYTNNGTSVWDPLFLDYSITYSMSITEDESLIYFTNGYNYYSIYTNGTIKYIIKNSYYTYWSCIMEKNEIYSYCGGDNYVYALELATATIKWKFEVDNTFDSMPILSPDQTTIYAITLGGYIYGLRIDGTLKFRLEIPNKPAIVSTPVISNDGFFLYFGSDDHKFYAVRVECPMASNCKMSSPSCSDKQQIDICYPRQCNDGYFNNLYDKSLCLPCSIPDNCKLSTAVKCNYDGTKSLCPIGLCIDGYYNNATSICTTCPPALNCNSTIATKCITNGINSECPLGMCNKGFYNSEQNGICIRCSQNIRCTVESDGCNSINGHNSICPVGSCQIGYYNNIDNKDCKLCQPAANCKTNITSGCDHYGTNSICPLNQCIDGYYNEGNTANKQCTKCPKANMCIDDAISCSIDGTDPLCPPDRCMDGYTNNGMKSACVSKAREYSSTQIGTIVAVSGSILILIISCIMYRKQIYTFIHNKQLHNYKDIAKIVWIILMKILLPLSNMATSVASYINLIDRQKIYQYDLANIYTVFIVLSLIATIASIIININIISKILNKNNTSENEMKGRIWAEVPSLIQLFFKNIPMLIINTILILNDLYYDNTPNNIYFVTIIISSISLGSAIGSVNRLIETYMTLRADSEYRTKRGSVIEITTLPTINNNELNKV